MSQGPLNPADRELEEALGSLCAARPTIDRDETIFLAGRRAERRTTLAWKGVAGVLCALLGVGVLLRPGPREIERVVYVRQAGPATLEPMPERLASSMDRPMAEAAYLSLREAVLARGLDALPAMRESRPAMDSIPELDDGRMLLRELQTKRKPL